MYIISENENLLERLRLVAQSSPLGDDQPTFPGSDPENDSHSAVFVATSIEDRNACGPGGKFIVLVGREWDPQVVSAIADIVRQILASENGGKIMVIKKELSEADVQHIADVINTAQSQWMVEWQSLISKVQKLGASAARKEALEKSAAWLTPQSPEFTITDFEDVDLPQRIKEYFALEKKMHIKEYSPADQPKLFPKPPALHWTNYPREAEIQVSFKFTLPPGALLEKLFREWVEKCRDCRSWEYEYEWTNGILLREELIKVTVVRTSDNVVEVSGRIDKDEVNEEDAEAPLRIVWPYLGKLLKISTDLLDEHPHLPYTYNIVLIGASFFKIHNSEEPSELAARSLNGIQTLGALERIHSVMFKVGDIIYEIRLDQAFPGFEPHTIADFWNANPEKTKLPTILDETPQILTESTSPAHQSYGSKSSASSGSSLLNVHKNRGRRVSFGAIRAIPTPGVTTDDAPENAFSQLNIDTSSQLKPPAMSPCHSEDEPETSPLSSNAPSVTNIADYVDGIIKKTLDEALVEPRVLNQDK
uniref:Uncharacterized protein n=1 Tax=Panagrellus redivivus TaxID=6233 RepID=A0A7E4ULW4_PANRE